ncbi:hypothetical protein [Paenibacillus sp. 1A_MP2]|uniref:hypothetical protein n=1 Tax=Paenibacillus sp. 1A_MP2 TaxID=3457495 RepID=UPI003FCEB8D0
MGKKMKVASFIGNTRLDASINEYFENDKLPIVLESFSELDELPESYHVYVFTDLKGSSERAERLLEKAKLVHGKFIVWLVTSEDQEWMEDAEESIRGERTVFLTNKPDPTPEDIVDALVTLFDVYEEVTEDPRSEETAQKKENLLASFDSDKGGSRLSSTLEMMKKVVPPIGRRKDSESPDKSNAYVPEESEVELDDLELDNVIAVSGHGSTGVSHVAWNIATVIQKPVVLIEGRKTGALAAWLGRNSGGLSTRNELFETGQGSQHTEYMDLALISDEPLSNSDVVALSQLKKLSVVDCGTNWNSEVFKRAKIKVFVTAPDPQFLEQDKPESAGVKWVLNKWPIGSSIELSAIEQAFNRKFDLVVAQQMRHVMLASWTRRAAIELESDLDIIQSWRKLIGEE